MEKTKLLIQQICLILFILPLIKSISDFQIPTYLDEKSVSFQQKLNDFFPNNGSFILHFKASNKLLIYNSSKNLIINTININASIYGQIVDLDKINQTHYMLYSQLPSTLQNPAQYIITQFNIFTSQKNNFFNVTASSLDIQITKKQMVLLNLNKSISRFNRLQKKFIENIQITNSYLNTSLKSTVCQINDNRYFVAVYVPQCYIKVLLCQDKANCNEVYANNNQRCDINKIDLQKQIIFNDDCYSISYEWEIIGVRILDLVVNLVSYQNILIQNIISTKFMDQLDQNIEIHRSTVLISTFSTNYWNNITVRNNYHFLPEYYESFRNVYYNFQQMKVFLSSATGNYLKIFQLKCAITTLTNLHGFCIKCPLNCTQCNLEIPQICYQCLEGLQVAQDYSCKKIQIKQIKVNPPYSRKSVPPIFKEEAIIQGFFKNSFDSGSDYILDNIFSFFQFVPISFLFMRFINFWSICSMYLFLDVQMPQALRAILNKIYLAVNKSVFQFLPIDLQLDLPIQQKFSEQLSSIYGISSDFFNSNIQNFITILFAYVLFGLLYLISKTIFKHTKMAKVLLSVNYTIFILMQYASNMGTVYFNLITLTQKGYQNNIIQKINLTLHMFFIVFSTLTPFFVFIFMRKQQQDDDQLIVKLKNAYDCMCNYFIVFTLVIGPLPIFFIFNLFFYIFSIYIARKQKQFRWNAIILASYLLIFHLGIVIMANFDSKAYPTLFHVTGVVTNALLFVGAIHEVLTLICGQLFQIVIYLKNYINSNKKVKDSNNQQNIYKQQNSLNDSNNKKQIKTQKIQIKKNSKIKGLSAQGTFNAKMIINLQQQVIKQKEMCIENISNIQLIQQSKMNKKIKYQSIHNNDSRLNVVETRRKFQQDVGNIQNIFMMQQIQID